MTHEIRVPEVSEGVTEGTVVDIAVAVGDRVEFDQTLLELETDKAVIAIPSPFAGTIVEIKVAQGASVPIGAVIMLLEAAGEAAAEVAVAGAAVEAQPEPQSEAKPVAQVEAKPAPAPAAVAVPAAAAADVQSAVDLTAVRRGDRVAPAAPSVRRLARDLGVDIYQVQGTGAGGRISEVDVRDFVR
ncbi:MAG: E3 binding domain-containing protein, partial [Desulfuromonadales bacterium]|nr:E3 binding domain-containing protein [Desulfuromonadales bacterium]